TPVNIILFMLMNRNIADTSASFVFFFLKSAAQPKSYTVKLGGRARCVKETVQKPDNKKSRRWRDF
ncbi:hypothetical protein, partial [Escherichia coli]|uniref:hypothetical protein n=1 Tax=Escherichia coli TaxID=562 RepID=UPI00390B1539